MKDRRLYDVWKAMRQRCNNPNHIVAYHYHKRGIRVCKAWDSFAAFEAWATANGYRRGLSIDRINGEKNYTPSNCRWVTRQEQNQNRARRKTSRQKYIGVAPSRHNWRADIEANSKRYFLGVFKTEKQAAIARDVAAIRLHGTYAKLNFPKHKRAA